MTAEQLYQQYIKPIPITGQLELFALISKKLFSQSEAEKNKQRSLLEFEGLGAELWEGVDAQNYIDDLRNEWNSKK